MSSFDARSAGGSSSSSPSPAPQRDGPAAAPGKSTLDTGSAEASPATAGAVKLKVENDQAAPAGGGKARTKVGVGERLFVTNEPATEGSFTSTAGTGKDEGTLYTWTAPETADKVTITFTPKDGGTASTVIIDVIAPDSVEFRDKKELSYGNVSAAGMKVKVVFLPLSVSFAALDWQEKDVAPSAVEGWFKSLGGAALQHKKGPGGYLDAKNQANDLAEWKSSTVVKEPSKLQWDIPQHYTVNGGTEQAVPNQPFTQLMTIDASGTTTVTKNGQTVTRAVPGAKK